jgi:hypothetical protein
MLAAMNGIPRVNRLRDNKGGQRNKTLRVWNIMVAREQMKGIGRFEGYAAMTGVGVLPAPGQMRTPCLEGHFARGAKMYILYVYTF